MTGVIIGVIGIIVTILVVAIPLIYRKLRTPIRITPKLIRISSHSPQKIGDSSQPWNIKTTFHLQNRTTEILFDVWIKFIVENCDLKTKDIQIDSEDGKGFLSGKISNISVDYDFVRMNGTDSKNRNCIFFILYSLVPDIPQPFTIEFKSVTRDEKNRNPRIILKVVRYSKTPVELLRQTNGVGYLITPPEKFLLESIALKMKREE